MQKFERTAAVEDEEVVAGVKNGRTRQKGHRSRGLHFGLDWKVGYRDGYHRDHD